VSSIDTVESGVPRIPVGDWIETGFDWVQDTMGDVFDVLADAISSSVNGLTDLLQWPPAFVTVAVFAALAWLARDWKLAL
jgi:glycine betaine/proline transport system permease protein